MLSRIAESLYWIGRYVERAEDTCRMLEVHLELMVDDPAIDAEESATALFMALGLPPVDDPLAPADVLRLVQYDTDSACSVVASLTGARESARRARETVSPDLWESLNTTWNLVRGGQFRRLRPAASLTMVRQRCALISGISDSTTSRDEGWQFLQLGRSIERIDMSARLMLWAAVTRRSSGAWNNALRAAGALHAFRRTHGAATLDRDAAQFLLLDRLFPRSVVFALTMAEDALNELEPGSRRSGFQSEAFRLLARTHAELEYLTLTEVLSELPERLADLQRTCLAVDEAITQRYFVGAPSPSWSGGHS